MVMEVVLKQCENVATLLRFKCSISLLGLQRMPSTSQFTQTEESRASTQQSLKGGHLSGSALEPKPSESKHVEPLVLREYNCSSDEQMVPASMPYQPYRSDFKNNQYCLNAWYTSTHSKTT